MPSFTLLPLIALLQPVPASPVHWQFAAGIGADGRVDVRLEAAIEEGWHIYALELPRDDGPLPTVIRILPGEGHVDAVEVREPAPEEVLDPNFAMLVRYHSGKPVFHALTDRTMDQGFRLSGEVEYMVCDDRGCLPPTTVPFTVEVPATAK